MPLYKSILSHTRAILDNRHQTRRETTTAFQTFKQATLATRREKSGFALLIDLLQEIDSSLIFIDGNASTAHKTCMRLPSNKTPNSFFHRKLTKPPATQTTLYSLPLLLCNFFNRKIHNGGSRAARVHGISQR